MARRGNGNGHGWGKGPGWGGPARGAGRGSAKAEPFTADNRPAGMGHNSNRRDRRQHLLDGLFELARTGGTEELQVTACIAWLNRFEGKPVAMAARSIATDLSVLTDADLEHELRHRAALIQTTRKKD